MDQSIFDKGSTSATICETCNSRNFIIIRELVHNIRVCEECSHTCKDGTCLRQLIGEHACVPCIMERIKDFVVFCMINKNTVKPSKIEEIVDGWVTYIPDDNKIIIWEEYWQKLCENNIIRERGDMYGWLLQLGKDPDLIKGNISCLSSFLQGTYNEEWYQDDIERAFYVICQSFKIKSIMKEGVSEGKQILLKRKNLKIKTLSLVEYVLNKKGFRYPNLHNIFTKIIVSHII